MTIFVSSAKSINSSFVQNLSKKKYIPGKTRVGMAIHGNTGRDMAVRIGNRMNARAFRDHGHE